MLPVCVPVVFADDTTGTTLGCPTSGFIPELMFTGFEAASQMTPPRPLSAIVSAQYPKAEPLSARLPIEQINASFFLSFIPSSAITGTRPWLFILPS